ncbi:MAG: hypothetical protein JW757_13800, partial [Anaerolineales bacterium]|nr:hypothetical protein [Anaerolineales bacterium]
AAMHACEHYALVLSPDTFKGKKNKKEIDNLLWEIDLAKKIERNIVPVLFDGFSFEEHLKNIPSELRNFLKRQFGLPISYHNVSGDLHKLSTRFLIPQREEVSTKPIPDKAKEDLMRLSAYPVTRSVVKPVNWPIVRQNISDSDGFVSTSEFLGLDEKQREKYLDGPIYVQFNDLLTAPPGGGDLTWDVSIDDSDGHSQSILKDQFDIGTRDGNDF